MTETPDNAPRAQAQFARIPLQPIGPITDDYEPLPAQAVADLNAASRGLTDVLEPMADTEREWILDEMLPAQRHAPAAIATMTASGMPAQQAARDLSDTIRALPDTTTPEG